jgi:phage protein D
MAVPSSGIFIIKYEGKDITRDISAHLIEVKYVDKTEGAADELTITLEDTEGLWKGEWFPDEGAKLQMQFGRPGNLVDAGTFEIDEIEASGSPETITIRALATGTSSAMRTKKSKAFENQSLRKIADEIAALHGLTVVDGTARETVAGRPDALAEIAQLKNVYAQIKAKFLTLTTVSDGTLGGSISAWSKILGAVIKSLRTKGLPTQANTLGGVVALLDNSLTNDDFGMITEQDARNNRINALTASHPVILAVQNSLPTSPVAASKTSSQLEQTIVARSTQNRETDLGYLARICALYGIIFSVRDTKLILVSQFDLEGGLPVSEIDKTELKPGWRITSKFTKFYKSARVVYHDPKKNEVVQHEEQAKDMPEFDYKNFKYFPQDKLEVKVKAENKGQAKTMARAALYRANSKQKSGSITIIGNPLLVAGQNFGLTGMGKLTGKYHITESAHTFNRGGGYETSLEIKMVGFLEKVKEKPKRAKKPAHYRAVS